MQVRAGLGSGRNCDDVSSATAISCVEFQLFTTLTSTKATFISPISAMSFKKTTEGQPPRSLPSGDSLLYLTTFSWDEPANSRTSFKFCRDSRYIKFSTHT